MKTWTVYIHTNNLNNKKYIGITSEKNPSRRWGHNGHGYLHKKEGKYCQEAMANAIVKYGWENFSHEIIAQGLSQEEAFTMEQELIKKYKTNKPKYGYNIENGGKSHKISPKTIEKIRKKHIRAKRSEETRKRISESNKGKQYNDDSKEKMSEAHSIPKHEPLEVAPNFMYNEEPCKCVETGICYHSISNAAKSVGSYTSNIGKCLQGARKRAGGYHWIKITEEEYQEYINNQNM